MLNFDEDRLTQAKIDCARDEGYAQGKLEGVHCLDDLINMLMKVVNSRTSEIEMLAWESRLPDYVMNEVEMYCSGEIDDDVDDELVVAETVLANQTGSWNFVKGIPNAVCTKCNKTVPMVREDGKKFYHVPEGWDLEEFTSNLCCPDCAKPYEYDENMRYIGSRKR